MCRKTACPNSTRLFFFFSYEDDDFFEGLIKSSPLLEILISNSFIFYWNFSSSRYPLNYFCYRWQFSLFFFFLEFVLSSKASNIDRNSKNRRGWLSRFERKRGKLDANFYLCTLAIYRLEEDFSLSLPLKRNEE